jgi:hypothetical protein
MYLPLGSSLKILIVMEGAPLLNGPPVVGAGQVDCAFALGAQQRPRPNETRNATQIFIGTTPSSQPNVRCRTQAYYFDSSQFTCKLQERDNPAKEDKDSFAHPALVQFACLAVRQIQRQQRAS